MNGHAWQFVTYLGDSGLLLPYVVLATLWLLLSPMTRSLSLAWLAVVFIGGLVVAATKVMYMGWHIGITGLDFIGLSGHTTLSFIVWPTLFLLLIGHSEAGQAYGVATGIVLAATIGVSRLVLHVHSLSEVLLGALVGGVLSAAFLFPRRLRLRLALPRLWLLASMMLPLMTGYGHPAPSGHLLAEVAMRLSGHAIVYTRADLHYPAHLQPLANRSIGPR